MFLKLIEWFPHRTRRLAQIKTIKFLRKSAKSAGNFAFVIQWYVFLLLIHSTLCFITFAADFVDVPNQGAIRI